MDTVHPEPEPLPSYGSPEEPRPPRPDQPQQAHQQAFGTSHEPPVTPGGPAVPPGARFFDTIRSWGVVRPDDGRWAAGVCAGLARRWGMKPGTVRILFVLTGLLTGIGLATYGVLWLLLPHPDGRIHAQQVLSGTVSAGFFGGLLAVLADHPFAGSWSDTGAPWRHHGPAVLPLALIALAIWWLLRRHPGDRTRPVGR